MAKLRKQTSDVAQALDRIQGFAENLIFAETNRRIQLGREKETRMIGAYNYMIGEEDAQISELEAALDAIETNLLERGVELKSVAPEYRTIASEEILTAANEGAIELAQAKLEGSQDYKARLEKRKREADKILRHVNLFGDAVSLVDPGEDKVVDAVDVAKVAQKFYKAKGVLYEPEMRQALEYMQTEKKLKDLNIDYYSNLKREAEEKITAHTAGATEDALRLEELKTVKQETQEGVYAQLPLFELRESYGPLTSVQVELSGGVSRETGKDLTSTERTDLEERERQELRSLGTIFYPWILNPEASADAAAKLRSMIMSASGISGTGDRISPRFEELLNYFKVAHAEYKLMLKNRPENAAAFKAEMEAMFGVDVSSSKWIANIIALNDMAVEVDIEEGEIMGRRFMSTTPSIETDDYDEGTKDPIMEKYGFE